MSQLQIIGHKCKCKFCHFCAHDLQTAVCPCVRIQSDCCTRCLHACRKVALCSRPPSGCMVRLHRVHQMETGSLFVHSHACGTRLVSSYSRLACVVRGPYFAAEGWPLYMSQIVGGRGVCCSCINIYLGSASGSTR